MSRNPGAPPPGQPTRTALPRRGYRASRQWDHRARSPLSSRPSSCCTASEAHAPLKRYVAFDFETTDKDVTTCASSRSAPVRVVDGEISTFHTLVNPFQPITSRATRSRYTDATFRGRGSFARFARVSLLRRRRHASARTTARISTFRCWLGWLAGRGGVDTLVFFDTWPLARSLSLAGANRRTGNAFWHRLWPSAPALDDAITLARALSRARAAASHPGGAGCAREPARYLVSSLALGARAGR